MQALNDTIEKADHVNGAGNGQDVSNRPNLFNIATSELSQDAFLCWLLSWADPKYVSINPALHRVGTDFLCEIYSKARKDHPAQFSTVKAVRQQDHIDIFCEVNGNTAIVIEDKVGTKQHSDQLHRYSKQTQRYSNKILVYIQTGDQDDYAKVTDSNYVVFKRRDLLAIFESQSAKVARQESDIFDDFSLHVRKIENDIESYSKLKLSAWTEGSWIGFYIKLQEILGKGEWRRVSNPSGGFYGFYWHFHPNDGCYDNDGCQQYLLLDHKSSSLCFKIAVSDKANRGHLRDLWCSKIKDYCNNIGFKIKKPDRFGNGNDMTVAVYDQNDFRITDSNGLLNLKETVSLLHTAEAALDSCISSMGEKGSVTGKVNV